MDNLLDKIKNGRFGFKIDEVMSGEHEFEPGMGPGGKHKFEFRVTWGPQEVANWLNPKSSDFLTQPLQGTVTAGGLCYEIPCQGTLQLDYFGERKIRYIFDFEVEDTEYQYIGEKVNIWPWNLPFSHTTCFGTVVEKDSRKLVSRSVTYFKLHTTPQFLSSFRLT